ncbi:poly(A)-specific ribonuclease [Marchantia polymorpha subsp. ruderalis]
MAPSRLLLPSINAIRVWTRPLSTAVARPRFSYQSPPKTRPIVMANVTKANFWETYEQLVIHLQTADFVALDFEMTGVETTPWRRHSELDTCDTRYLHIKHSAESFAVWQCGVCPFKWDEPGQKFIAYPYNFYIFPRNELPVEMPSRSYFCQTASLEFLAKHRFDFNTTVYNGISYLSREQEEIARDKLGLTEEAQKWKRLQAEMEPEIPLTRTGDVLFSEKVRVQLGAWRDGVMRNQQRWEWTDPGGGSSGRRSSISSIDAVTKEKGIEGFKDTWSAKSDAPSSSSSDKDRPVSDGGLSSHRPSFFVDIFGNNQARLVKQVLRKHFQDLVAVVIDKPNAEDRKQVKVIFTTSKEDKLKLEKELEEENRKKLEAVVFQAVGFRKVIDAIEASGIPLIGHNCLLDLAHLHDKFLGPLPPNVRGFSASISRHFPCILDTKYLLKTEPTLREANSRSTSLAIVYQQLCQGFSDQAGIPGRFYNGKPRIVTRPISRVKVEIASELQRYSGGTDTGLKHEAGFDAYMTGSVFAQICHLLQVDTATIRSLPQAAMSQVDSRLGFASYTNLLMLQTFKGQLALDLRTGKEALGDRAPRGPQSPPYRLLNRENVVLVWGLPSKIQDPILRKMVQNVFSKEKRLANVEIICVDESSAFVEFRSAAILEAFMRAFEVALSDSSNSEALLDLRDFKVARFAAYERICRSPLSTETLGISADLLKISHFEDIVAINNSNRAEVAEVRASSHQEPSSLNGGIQTTCVNEFRFNEHGPAKEEFAAASWSPEEGLITDDIQSPPGISLGTEATKSTVDVDAGSSTKSIRPIGIDPDSPDAQHGLEGDERPAVTASYSRWMKRVFDEDEASPSSPPKKRRTLEDPKDV